MLPAANVFGPVDVQGSHHATLGQRISNTLRSGSVSISHARIVHIHINCPVAPPTRELGAAGGMSRWCLERQPNANVGVDSWSESTASAPSTSAAQEPTMLPSAAAPAIPTDTTPAPGSEHRRRLRGMLRIWWQGLFGGPSSPVEPRTPSVVRTTLT